MVLPDMAQSSKKMTFFLTRTPNKQGFGENPTNYT